MKTIVVKIGSSVIAPGGKLNRTLIAGLVKDILNAEKKGYKVVLVSSGAIACGLAKLGLKKRPHDKHSLMAIASLGQIALMDVYEAIFKKHRKLCAQILLIWDDFDARRRFINARNTIHKLFSMGVVPIINENDSISYEEIEIKFGDNDRLSAMVGDLIGADMLIILSDVDGLLHEGKVVRVIPKIDSQVFSMAKTEDKVFTTGGMAAKLTAARVAVCSGIKTVIANGKEKGVISRIISGEDIGTVFLPVSKIKHARKRWIAFSKKIKGRIYVDDGAKEAVLNKGKSLLSVGIIKAEGQFKKKDAVELRDKDGNLLGCGLIDYSIEELCGAQGKKLPREVIHRDNFVVAQE